MRFLLNFACVALLIAAAFPALAQETSIKVEQPWARATPRWRQYRGRVHDARKQND